MADPYEVAVYAVDHVEGLAIELRELLLARTAEITDARARVAVIAAALATAAQAVDRQRFAAAGVSGTLHRVVSQWGV